MILARHPHLGVATSTHPGRSGKMNEDRLAVASFETASGQPVLFAVVSDGIGGHRAGEVAAQLTVERIVQVVADSTGREPLRIMEAAIHAASQAIFERAGSSPREAGMGSTCACTWVEGDRLYTSHVGDSRIYLVHEGRIHCTTADHTWIREAIQKGLITPEQGRNHPNAHVLRRHLGSAELPQVDVGLHLHTWESEEQARNNQGMQLQPGDHLLLCTDGLTDMVGDDEILRLITERRALEAATQDLISRANAAGGRDNITVVLMGVPEAVAAEDLRRGFFRRILKN